MRVTFIGYGTEQLGISQLSAIARHRGHDVSLAFTAALFNDHYNLDVPWLAPLFDEKDRLVDDIVRLNPDLLACSPLTNTWGWMQSMLAAVRKRLPNLRVIVGGVHATAAPERMLALSDVDYVVSGEGDLAFPALLDALADGGPTEPIDNLLFTDRHGAVIRGKQAGFVQDLDTLPAFDKRLWEDHLRLGDIYLTMAGRGCPFRCTFCFNSFFASLPDGRKGKYVRMRSVDHVMAELLAAKKRYNLKLVDFEDDVFTVDKKWLKRLLDRYRREIAVPFICLTHPRYMDDDIARWLADAGCTWVQMGVQSADEDFRVKHLQRPEADDAVEVAMRALRRYGIEVKVDHIFGLPDEPLSAQDKALKLYAHLDAGRIQTFWANLLPGTVMFEQERATGRLSQEQAERILDGHGGEYFRAQGARGSERDSHLAYETVFRLMPLLPTGLRDQLQASHVRWLPGTAKQVVGIGADLLNAAVRRNPDHGFYARHYADQLRRFGQRRVRRTLNL
ncbi:MAG: B12-binding domain-containing radical SAM protein [Myxococcales bacterium]|nr:B12-binding domain-containing radical SAM protein [Myxococcales bacterium]